jgi:hypothetical protein
MKPPMLCVLNLTSSGQHSSTSLSVGPLSFGVKRFPDIFDFKKIPAHQGPLILYIVDHAVPDALLVRRATGSPNDVIPEPTVADAVIRRRRENPTLIIWDLCYARSFERIKGYKWSDKPYVHIFGCEAHEQSWHTGGGVRQTLLSMALQASLNSGVRSWDTLENKLNDLLAPVQRPSIAMMNVRSTAVFGLAGRRAAKTSKAA